MTEEIKLDVYDKRILFAFEKNCKINVSSLAKKLNLSKQRVSYKIKRLEENKIILGYTSIIDVSRLGYITFRLYLKFQNRTFKEREELINSICKIENISVAIALDSIWDVGFALMVKNISSFYKSWDKIMAHKEFIENYYVSIYEPIYYMTRTFLDPDVVQVPDVKIVGANSMIKYDDFDVLLLKEYCKNIKQPILDLAKKLNKSPIVVINRIKHLEKEKVIVWNRANLDFSKLGYQYYKVIIKLNDFTKIQQLYDYCISSKYIFQIDKTISEWDFEIEIYAKNKTHFNDIMDQLQEKFNKHIKNYIYFTVDKLYKEEFMP
jgi:Lrp/AsnC family transcriptional regulator, leucine-responsive regulatory protein